MTDRLHDQAPETALAWHHAGQGAVLATVIETWSSAPRPVGSQLAISGSGAFVGSVSGGCVEGAVVIEAEEALADGKPRTLSFGVSDETAFAAGLACGGQIRILLEPVGAGGLPVALLSDLVSARAAATPVALVTRLDDWSRNLSPPGSDPLVDARFRLDRSGLEEDGRFVAIHNPPLRLIIVGAVHLAAPLLTMARSAGYACQLIDPRTGFASVARFPGEMILDDWPDEAIARLAPDARTAIVTLAHDPKLDDPALMAALASDAFYIGCLGSRRNHAARLERLAAQGASPQALARLHGPVGLAIGAVTPAEIAISILAEMTGCLRRLPDPLI